MKKRKKIMRMVEKLLSSIMVTLIFTTFVATMIAFIFFAGYAILYFAGRILAL